LSGRTRVVHLSTRIAYGPLAELAPDLAIMPTHEGDIEEVPMGLAMIDKDDEETHVYPLAPAVRNELLEKLGRPPQLVVPEGI